MRNFSIHFAYSWSPWLLFLLIPAIALALIPYFRLAKKYRRTRNRVVSLVLHCLVMFLTICVLTGMTFAYSVANPENEIIFLVDVSDTQRESAKIRDEYVQQLLYDSSFDGFKVGVVTFGFTQSYAVPLTYEVDLAYDQYLGAELPDTSATNIAAALRYTRTLFTNPRSSKIVLITDGKETDENAQSVIRSITSQGTKVDAVNIASGYEGDNAQVLGIDFPDYHLNINEECDIIVNIQSNTLQTVELQLFDNGTPVGDESSQIIELAAGIHNIPFRTSFSEEGLHEIRAVVKNGLDSVEQNNEYYSYINLDFYNNILVIERYEGDSVSLENLLGQVEGTYNVEVLNLALEEAPKSVDELRAYDQIIMNNVANKDLPEGFDELLYSYVYDCGGGLFTVGGKDPEGNAHAYNRSDLNNTLYQQILPVQAINYTPPVGVIIIIDISGSMMTPDHEGISALEWAKQGAIACLDALTERDFVGIMTLDTVYSTILPLTSCTQERVIREAILNIREGGATNFTNAIDRAGQALVLEPRVDKRHIILVTDGAPTDSAQDYLPIVDTYYTRHGVTVSAVGIGMREGGKEFTTMDTLVQHGHGRLHVASGQKLLEEMREDLNAPEIEEVEEEPFNPTVADKLSPLLHNVEYRTIEIRDQEGKVTKVIPDALEARLGGFYGVQAKASAETVLMGEYEVPIYSQWKFGAGMVGSFMCDLSGEWSSEFLADPSGQQFIYNAINNLMPLTNIRPNEIVLKLREDNYTNSLSVYAGLNPGESIKAEIKDSAGNVVASLNEVTPTEELSERDCYVTLALTANNEYSRCNFILKESGVYSICITKYDAENNEVAKLEAYKSFAYSEEYDSNLDAEELDPAAALQALIKVADGNYIEKSEELFRVFDDFVTELTHTFDPRWLFIILAIVLFLLDIAVRKFKFKWIHEIVRERKAKKAERQKTR